ncbi:dihydrofolate reductase family protein [Anatilimnocola floriformis]|uniref:dihydrofolate reductase family protein n=1 Tax=Anatilimnocola floriformis TaxID=2948575 RepID=UPI0020C4DC5C|nr:dihydrofolate reductase family protein [Anatilimnocola floriformis]
MGKLILSMNVSLDGYVDDLDGGLVMGAPSAEVFRFWIEAIRDLAATIYGRRMYEVMRYWDEDRPEWNESLREFAVLWRRVPKWVVSSTLANVGPNATLITGDIETQVRALKARTDGLISVSGPQTAGLMTRLGLVDEYHLVLRPFVLGKGKPLFADARPPLRLVSSKQLDDNTLHLVYEPL